MLTEPLYLAQGNIGDSLFDLCSLTGLVILPGAIISWAIFFSGNRRFATRASATVFTILAVLWIAMELEYYFFEPKFDETGASVLIENLPDIVTYENHHTGARVTFIDPDHPASDIPFHSLEFDVGMPGQVWRRFRINLVNSEISVFIESEGWISIEKWRTLATTRPALSPTH